MSVFMGSPVPGGVAEFGTIGVAGGIIEIPPVLMLLSSVIGYPYTDSS